MLTKNYKSLMIAYGATHGIAASYQQSAIPVQPLTTTGGDVKYAYGSSVRYNTSNDSFLNGLINEYGKGGSAQVCFSSSTAEPTSDDYILTGRLDANTDITVNVPATLGIEVGDDYYEITAAYTVKALRDLTIASIYLLGYYALTPNITGGSSSMNWVIVDHTLLDEPVTLAENETTVITYRLRFYF